MYSKTLPSHPALVPCLRPQSLFTSQNWYAYHVGLSQWQCTLNSRSNGNFVDDSPCSRIRTRRILLYPPKWLLPLVLPLSLWSTHQTIESNQPVGAKAPDPPDPPDKTADSEQRNPFKNECEVNAKIWALYQDKAKGVDERLKETQNSGLDTLLIVVSLYLRSRLAKSCRVHTSYIL